MSECTCDGAGDQLVRLGLRHKIRANILAFPETKSTIVMQD